MSRRNTQHHGQGPHDEDPRIWDLLAEVVKILGPTIVMIIERLLS